MALLARSGLSRSWCVPDTLASQESRRSRDKTNSMVLCITEANTRMQPSKRMSRAAFQDITAIIFRKYNLLAYMSSHCQCTNRDLSCNRNETSCMRSDTGDVARASSQHLDIASKWGFISPSLQTLAASRTTSYSMVSGQSSFFSN